MRTETCLDQSTIQVESLVQSQQTQEQDTKSIENSAKDTIVEKIDGHDKDIEKMEVEGTPGKITLFPICRSFADNFPSHFILP